MSAPQDAAALDARLVPPALAGWLGAFVATGQPPGASAGWLVLLGLATVGAAACCVPVLRRRLHPAGWAVAMSLLALLAGATVGGLARTAVAHSGLAGPARDGAVVRAAGVVTADPVRLAGTSAPAWSAALVLTEVRVDAVEVRGVPTRTRARVLVRSDHRRWAGLLPGQRVVFVGRLGTAPAGRPVAASVSVRGPPSPAGAPPVWQRAAGDLRAGLRVASDGLPPGPRGLLPGLVLGDTTRMPADLVTDFRTAGMTHLTAVSGANLAIVTGFVLWAARWAGVRGRWLPVLAASAMAFFVVLARPQPSVLRAAVMGGIGLVALGTGRRRGGLSALSAATLLLVLVDPWLARSYGFVLSVLATAGLVLLAPGWAASWTARGVPRPLADALAVPLAAQLVCSPVVVLLSGQVSVVGVLANVLAAPAVAPATVLGVLVTVAAPASSGLAETVAVVAGVPTWWIVEVAQRCAALPTAAVPWPDSVRGALLLALASAVSVLAGRSLARRPFMAGAAAVLLAVVLVVPATSPGWPPRGWVLAVCDVGQGDALALAAGPGAAVVVDAGPEPRAVDRCLRRLGVRRVPIVLLTHLHADHVAGLPGVLRGREVDEVGVGVLTEPAEQLGEVRRVARRAGVPVRRAGAGERMTVGALSWRILWPRRMIPEESVANNASLVLLVRSHGLRLLLTGDIEPPAQRALLASGPLPRVDVLKVAHHGSAEQDDDLLAAVRPRLALVSVGAGNGYGHPAPTTMAALRRSGAVVGRTDRDGTLVVTGPSDRLRVVRGRR